MSTAPAPTSTQNPPRQRGAALIVSLMMLVAITLIGVAVMSNSRLEWLMATNNALQTSTYPQAEAALIAAENQIRTNICAGGPTPPTNCNPANFNWAANDAFYSQPAAPPAPDPGVAVVADPFPAGANSDPRNINNWGAFNSNGVGATSRYVVLYLGCDFVPNPANPPGPATTCGGANTTSAFTFQIWVSTQDAKGVAHLVQATYVLMTNTWPNNVNVGTDAPMPAPAAVQPGTPIVPATQFRRIGQVEIDTCNAASC